MRRALVAVVATVVGQLRTVPSAEALSDKKEAETRRFRHAVLPSAEVLKLCRLELIEELVIEHSINSDDDGDQSTNFDGHENAGSRASHRAAVGLHMS